MTCSWWPSLSGLTSGIYSLAFSGQAAALHLDIYLISVGDLHGFGHEIYFTAVLKTLRVERTTVADIARAVSAAQGTEDARSFTHPLIEDIIKGPKVLGSTTIYSSADE